MCKVEKPRTDGSELCVHGSLEELASSKRSVWNLTAPAAPNELVQISMARNASPT
jgi:hypothetical protein